MSLDISVCPSTIRLLEQAIHILFIITPKNKNKKIDVRRPRSRDVRVTVGENMLLLKIMYSAMHALPFVTYLCYYTGAAGAMDIIGTKVHLRPRGKTFCDPRYYVVLISYNMRSL